MKKVTLVLFIILVSNGLFAQEIFKLYDGQAPGSEEWTDPELSVPAPWSGKPLVYNVTEPTITVYRPDNAINTGAAMIIAPGGGNRFLTWEEEGTNVAEWFQRHGITGILLKYRTNQAGSLKEIEESLKAVWPPQPVSESEERESTETRATAPVEASEKTIQGDDGRQAIKYVRQHASELGIKPDKIGIVGFSAGAMLAANIILFHDELSRPNLVASIYGGGLTSNIHQPMPLYLCSPVNDIFPADNLFKMHKNWKSKNVPVDLHLIYDARHGDGLQYNGKAWNEWIDNLFNFMKSVEFIE